MQFWEAKCSKRQRSPSFRAFQLQKISMKIINRIDWDCAAAANLDLTPKSAQIWARRSSLVSGWMTVVYSLFRLVNYLPHEGRDHQTSDRQARKGRKGHKGRKGRFSAQAGTYPLVTLPPRGRPLYSLILFHGDDATCLHDGKIANCFDRSALFTFCLSWSSFSSLPADQTLSATPRVKDQHSFLLCCATRRLGTW